MSVYVSELFGQQWGVFCSMPVIIREGLIYAQDKSNLESFSLDLLLNIHK